MTSHANTHFADGATSECVSVSELEALSQHNFRVRFGSAKIANAIRPGQFLMVRISGCDDPLIGRAFALFDCDPHAGWVDFVFVIGGKMTCRLAGLAIGAKLDVWGPLGNGFSMQPADDVFLVAGGIGYTPFLATAKAYSDSKTNVTFCFGARSASELTSLDQFRELGVNIATSTDDGSAGHHGLITDVLNQKLVATEGTTKRILCCGPEPMMEAVSEIALRENIPCEVSLETPMACGIGICFSCVARIRDASGGWDYRRTCVEGPVFPAGDVCW